MDKEKIHEMIKTIGTTEDEAERRELLAQIDENIDPIYDERDKAVEEAKKLAEDNEAVRQANMKLFLRLGSDKPDDQIKQEQMGVKDDATKPREFKDLFNDKGELKK